MNEPTVAMGQVCLDLHEALGVKWGDDPYARIRQLLAVEAELDAAKRALAFPDVPPRSVIEAINEHAYRLYCGANPNKDANALALYMDIRAALAAKYTEQTL